VQRRICRAVLALLTLSAGAALAQATTKLDLPRPSPHGSVTQTVGLTEITVAFSSPGVKGRKIWGEVVPFDKVWRAGANECTKLTVSTPISIEGKPLAAGSYCVFLLPQKTGWTFILSKNLEQAGSDEYKQSEDALRVPATTSTIPMRERLALTVTDFDDEKGTLAMEWETQRVGVKFTTGTHEKVMAQIRGLKSDDWGQYNAAARYLLTSGSEPALAMQLVDHSIKLKETWSNVWTKAQLQHAAGKNSEALALAQKAQTLGKDSKNFFAADDVAKALVSWKK
jgi:hypothetical protein